MPRLLLVRHGESVWNAEARWQGWADPPLSTRGEEQALSAASRLRECGLGGISSSDLRRARQTAEVLAAELGIALGPSEPGLRERDVGQWSGLTRREIDARWPGQHQRWVRGELAAPPGGEDYSAFTHRVVEAVFDLASRVQSESLLVVTHGGVIRALENRAGEQTPTLANLDGRWFEVEGADIRPGSVVVLNDPDLPTAAPVF